MVEDRLFRQPQQHSELPPRRETSFNDNMNYSFQPQWRQWNYFPCQLPTMPTCGRCGNKHLYKVCYSLARSCYKYQNKESEAETNQILEELIKKNSELSEELEEYKEFEEENTMFDSDGEETYFITNKDVDKMLEEQSDTHLKLVSKLEDEN
ncbi:unnamed protein product [Mytilus edulis]|uniref:Uncharacterized protein n=1 Tax=Mytilus edulis TaxID=6550 RepID=A0A8S3QK47_MYTED|nr:unnamed protein product [Mytilus edulis]